MTFFDQQLDLTGFYWTWKEMSGIIKGTYDYPYLVMER